MIEPIDPDAQDDTADAPSRAPAPETSPVDLTPFPSAFPLSDLSAPSTASPAPIGAFPALGSWWTGSMPDVLSRSTDQGVLRGIGDALQELSRGVAPRWRWRPYYPLLVDAANSRRAALEAGALNQFGLAPDYMDAHRFLAGEVKAGRLGASDADYIHSELAAVQRGAPLPSIEAFAGEPPQVTALHQLGQKFADIGERVAPSPVEKANHPIAAIAGDFVGETVPGIGVAAISGPFAPLTTSTFVGAQGAGAARRAAIERGESEEEQNRAAGAGFAIGALTGGIGGPLEQRGLDLLTRAGLEAHARQLGINFTAETSNSQLRGLVSETLAARAPPEQAGKLSALIQAELDRVGRFLGFRGDVHVEPGEVGTYPDSIERRGKPVPARCAEPGHFGPRELQPEPDVDAFELKVNPNDESFYLRHPNGRYVQFENAVGDTVQDAKFVSDAQRSWYRDFDRIGAFARNAHLRLARDQVVTASHSGMKVEWLVSDGQAAANLDRLFRAEGIPVKVT